MVTRSSSGTGVVVSLVVFVLCTVFLLVLTIVFYSGQAKATEAEATAEATLARFVTREQRNRDSIKAIEAKVNPNRGESVVRYLQQDFEQLMEYVSGNGQTDLQTLHNEFGRYGVSDDATVRAVLLQQHRDLKERQTELDGLAAKLNERDDRITELQGRLEQLEQDHQEELDAVTEKIGAYQQAADEYREEVRKVQAEYYGAVDRLQQEYEGEIARLETEKDNLFQERVVLKTRVDELQQIMSISRIKAQDPSTLVDGLIVDTVGGSEVFINRGKADRVTLGMTFEVYDNESALQQVDLLTGQLPRGKASLQVTQVLDTTSKCKITRAVPGRPVVRNNVIANAVYDPNYIFKFLVHGKFDVDGDGRPTENEAGFLRSLIVKWGGEVISGEMLPGDLDFLVLGVEPPRPLPPRPDATEFELDAWVLKRRAHEKYHELFRQASEAQIPVLNANRFFILIGYTDR